MIEPTSPQPLHLFVSAPKHLEVLLAEELVGLGATDVHQRSAGASCRGDLALAYRLCVWSRLANRVFTQLHNFAAADADALYRGGREIDWAAHIPARATFAVHATTRRSAIDHTHFAALRLKDAIVDQLRDDRGARPDVDTQDPDIRIHLHLDSDQATVSLDLAGESLHRRGYRGGAGRAEAPLKENVAAGILLRVGWAQIAADGGGLLDPMCGSGTLLIEGAMIAADIAPGLGRSDLGSPGWPGHDGATFRAIVEDAKSRRTHGLAALQSGRVAGADIDARALSVARDCIAAAGLAGHIALRRCDVADATLPPAASTGLVITNAPYGERLGDRDTLAPVYRRLGDRLRGGLAAYRAALLTSDLELARATGLRASRRNVIFNGDIECSLLRFDAGAPPLPPSAPRTASPAAGAFVNRVRKNKKRLASWVQRTGVTCYRVYDADLPEYAVAIDSYQTDRGLHLHVQEYAPPASIDPHKARRRLDDVIAVLPDLFDVAPGRIHLKTRRKQKGRHQYEKLAERAELCAVTEGGHTFLVNFTDYLDTGLFLDHRRTRAMIGELSAGRDFLSLFGYTGTASVYAARSGARSTTTVDLSSTYTAWCEQNFARNRLEPGRNQAIRADCRTWMEEHPRTYGLIFLDPPTFSNSKAMATPFDLQADYPTLIARAARLLTPGGLLIFSNNFRKFKMRKAAVAGTDVTDITAQTIDEDFRRNPRIHNCWRITNEA